MPRADYDPTQPVMAGTFDENVARRAFFEQQNQMNVLRSDRNTWRRLCREAQERAEKAEAELAALRKVVESNS